MRLIWIVMILATTSFCLAKDRRIDDRGIWHGMDAFHLHDPSLADALVEFFQKEHAETVIDFGCGLGDYVKTLLKAGIYCDGFDGAPDTYEVSGGVARVIDLSIPFNIGKKYDWVLSLEVGEHLPPQFETIFIENLIRHADKGIVLSWALKGQDGYGHFNTQNNDYVKARMATYGFVNDLESEAFLRAHSSFTWFKSTVMVFRRPF